MSLAHEQMMQKQRIIDRCDHHTVRHRLTGLEHPFDETPNLIQRIRCFRRVQEITLQHDAWGSGSCNGIVIRMDVEAAAVGFTTRSSVWL